MLASAAVGRSQRRHRRRRASRARGAQRSLRSTQTVASSSRERVERGADAAHETVGVREPIALGAQPLRLPVGKLECVELRDLKTQQLDFGLPLRARRAPVLELLEQRLPRREALGYRRRERRYLFVRVEQCALVAGVEQRLMRVLAMNVDEQAAEGSSDPASSRVGH